MSLTSVELQSKEDTEGTKQFIEVCVRMNNICLLVHGLAQYAELEAERANSTSEIKDWSELCNIMEDPATGNIVVHILDPSNKKTILKASVQKNMLLRSY